jgi:galactonate dehydratase
METIATRIKLLEECAAAREGVGRDGDWIVDCHQRFDLEDVMRSRNAIEGLAPFFCKRS